MVSLLCMGISWSQSALLLCFNLVNVYLLTLNSALLELGFDDNTRMLSDAIKMKIP